MPKLRLYLVESVAKPNELAEQIVNIHSRTGFFGLLWSFVAGPFFKLRRYNVFENSTFGDRANCLRADAIPILNITRAIATK